MPTTPKPPPLLCYDDVSMTFPNGHEAVRGVRCELGGGEFVSVVGPSGCGKSTLLRLAAGLIGPTVGRVTVAGMPPADGRRTSHRVGFVFQDHRLLPWRRVAGNIGLTLELTGIPREKRQRRIAASLELIGLTAADATKFPRMLSGGMRMRVSLVRALVTEPEILLLDEPFAALDDIMRQRLNEDLTRIWLDQRPTTLFVTHNVSEAVFLSQRVLVMSGSPGTILHDVPVSFDYPRPPQLRGKPEFARLVEDIASRLRGTSP